MMKKILPLICSFFMLVNLTQAQQIPDFTLTDMDGKEHNLHTLLENGKPVILDFFASWCGPCAFSSVELEDFYATNGSGNDRLEILSITIEDDDTEEVVADIPWGGDYPTFAYDVENDNQFSHYANTLGYNSSNAIPFFIFICPDVDDPGNSTIIKGDVGFQGGMFVFQYQAALNTCVASLPLTGVNELEGLSAFTVFPNPVTDELNLAFYLDESMDSEILIYNTLGQVVQRVDKQTYLAGDNFHNVDVSELSNGMYVVAYETTEGRVTETFNVTR